MYQKEDACTYRILGRQGIGEFFRRQSDERERLVSSVPWGVEHTVLPWLPQDVGARSALTMSGVGKDAVTGSGQCLLDKL